MMGARPRRLEKKPEEVKNDPAPIKLPPNWEKLLEATEKQRQETTPKENSIGSKGSEGEHQRLRSVKVNPDPLEEVPGEPESNPEEARETPTPEVPSAAVRRIPRPARTNKMFRYLEISMC